MKTTEVCFKAEIRKVEDFYLFDFPTDGIEDNLDELWQKAQQSVENWLQENEELVLGHKIALKLKDRTEYIKN